MGCLDEDKEREEGGIGEWYRGFVRMQCPFVSDCAPTTRLLPGCLNHRLGIIEEQCRTSAIAISRPPHSTAVWGHLIYLLPTSRQSVASIHGNGLSIQEVVAGDEENSAGHVTIVTWSSGRGLALMLLLGDAGKLSVIDSVESLNKLNHLLRLLVGTALACSHF